MRNRLLIIEDEVSLMTLLVELALERGYDASGVFDGAVALGRVRAVSPHVVLLDLRLNLNHGWTLLRQILAEPAAPAVIVMSGWVDEKTHELCRSHGVIDVVSKPFVLDDLFRRVDAAAALQRAT